MSSSTRQQYSHHYTDWGFNRLEEVSRTFALSIQYLPSPMKTYVSTSYLLCRIPDTIEDDAQLTPTQKKDALRAFQVAVFDPEKLPEFLEKIEKISAEIDIENDPDWNLVLETEKVFELWSSFPNEIQDAMRPWVAELTYGMHLFIDRYEEPEGVRIQSADELEEYCYYVAGTVGHLLTTLISVEYDEPATGDLHQAAEEYGLVLQLINIAKDVYDDYEVENNIYLPLDDLSAVGVSAEHITDSENIEAVGTVVEDVVTRAESYESQAQNFLEWARDTNAQVFESFAIPYLLAVATMRELKANTEMATDPGEVKIERSEVMNIASVVTQKEVPPITTLAEDIRNRKYC